MLSLKEIRLQKLISQRQLAKLAGVTYVTVNRIERGTSKASELTRAKLAKALGVSISDIDFW